MCPAAPPQSKSSQSAPRRTEVAPTEGAASRREPTRPPRCCGRRPRRGCAHARRPARGCDSSRRRSRAPRPGPRRPASPRRPSARTPSPAVGRPAPAKATGSRGRNGSRRQSWHPSPRSAACGPASMALLAEQAHAVQLAAEGERAVDAGEAARIGVPVARRDLRFAPGLRVRVLERPRGGNRSFNALGITNVCKGFSPPSFVQLARVGPSWGHSGANHAIKWSSASGRGALLPGQQVSVDVLRDRRGRVPEAP